ncbi:hypothetical protein [Anaerophaga thermohalophila]|uniref:hypothetical protein n=1 Tax=Anaerophaga thermohalophila TaxID=177400 RepID=UPI000237C2D0|nr:hypothetical protein [Anaerophaga thermohalophila]
MQLYKTYVERFEQSEKAIYLGVPRQLVYEAGSVRKLHCPALPFACKNLGKNQNQIIHEYGIKAYFVKSKAI